VNDVFEQSERTAVASRQEFTVDPVGRRLLRSRREVPILHDGNRPVDLQRLHRDLGRCLVRLLGLLALLDLLTDLSTGPPRVPGRIRSHAGRRQCARHAVGGLVRSEGVDDALRTVTVAAAPAIVDDWLELVSYTLVFHGPPLAPGSDQPFTQSSGPSTPFTDPCAQRGEMRLPHYAERAYEGTNGSPTPEVAS
jgi:hypothetical protein